MLFWVAAALLTLCACMAVLAPVMRARPTPASDADFDLEVYRDQLAEIDRDRARGVIDGAEAEQAKAEVARRILKLDAAKAGRPSLGGRLTKIAATVAILAVPLVSWGIYAATGSPWLPAQPLQARLDKNPAESTVEELVARAEGHLAANPSDGRGWEVLAPIYFRMGRHQEAVTAYRNSIRLNGSTADRETGLGEALAAAAGGPITTEAQAAFERALALEPMHPKAQYLLASAYAQEGKIAEAARILRTMLSGLEQDSPWRGAVEQALAGISASAAPEVAERGPGEQDIEAAASMSPEDRAAMIETMVASLDQRLQENPDDPEGWRKLVRSYVVLGRAAEARAALERGIAALGEDSADAAGLVELAASLGVGREE
jgi:cytochrome c-type biogenesis protein CcmH